MICQTWTPGNKQTPLEKFSSGVSSRSLVAGGAEFDLDRFQILIDQRPDIPCECQASQDPVREEERLHTVPLSSPALRRQYRFRLAFPVVRSDMTEHRSYLFTE